MSLPLIIGQAPARGNDGKPPFSGQSGARLARLAGVGESGDDLPAHFELINLNKKWPGKRVVGKGDQFDMDEAKKRAEKIKLDLEDDSHGRFVLLMGRKVERAMGWRRMNYLEINTWGSHAVILFPHPSGVSRWWNDKENVMAARAILMWVLRVST